MIPYVVQSTASGNSFDAGAVQTASAPNSGEEKKAAEQEAKDKKFAEGKMTGF